MDLCTRNLSSASGFKSSINYECGDDVISFVGPHKEFYLIWAYLPCDSRKLWIFSRVLENHHLIGIKTKSALIFIEEILCKIGHGMIFTTTTWKLLSNFKALWCFIHKILQYDEISFVLLEILVQLSRNTFHIFQAHFHKLLKKKSYWCFA